MTPVVAEVTTDQWVVLSAAHGVNVLVFKSMPGAYTTRLDAASLPAQSCDEKVTCGALCGDMTSHPGRRQVRPLKPKSKSSMSWVQQS
ncbi:hypothetical protein C0Q70_21145 [Pomacea canaliculata]|uniref:Uncharacterized protein n=1 Tax=Pomacea canaliculata TaxID=400727 RepID=A0A2T7NBQ8_POMCA|nr:hypothetical protein C0Q70_21145 [Pomacea canaliculata]